MTPDTAGVTTVPVTTPGIPETAGAGRHQVGEEDPVVGDGTTIQCEADRDIQRKEKRKMTAVKMETEGMILEMVIKTLLMTVHHHRHHHLAILI